MFDQKFACGYDLEMFIKVVMKLRNLTSLQKYCSCVVLCQNFDALQKQ